MRAFVIGASLPYVAGGGLVGKQKAAYIENVGHEPPDPPSWAWDQWAYTPRSKYGRAYIERLHKEACVLAEADKQRV